MFKLLDNSQKEKDKAAQRRQKLLTLAAIPLVKTMDQLMKLEVGQVIQEQDLSNLKNQILDSFTAISQANSKEVSLRKEHTLYCIGNLTGNDVNMIISEDNRDGESLFSDAAIKSMAPELKTAAKKKKFKKEAYAEKSKYRPDNYRTDNFRGRREYGGSQNQRKFSSSTTQRKNYQANPTKQYPSGGWPHKRGRKGNN